MAHDPASEELALKSAFHPKLPLAECLTSTIADIAKGRASGHLVHYKRGAVVGITPFEAAAVLIVLVATLAFINQRFIGLPQSVAMTGMAAVASLIVMGVDQLMPKAGLSNYVVALVDRIDFQTTLLNGMLSFLLFAGALHVNWTEMRRGQWPILILSTLGVIVSTLVVGTLFWLGAGLLGISIPLIWSMVFGALISPTDPVAVIGVLKRTKCPPTS